HVSGVAALLLQRDPHLDSATIRQILTATAKNPSGAKGRNDELGYGVVDPERALNSLNAKSAGTPATTARANCSRPQVANGTQAKRGPLRPRFRFSRFAVCCSPMRHSRVACLHRPMLLSRPRAKRRVERRRINRKGAMMRKDNEGRFNRRKFLAGVAIAGAASTVPPAAATAATTATPVDAPPRRPSALPPNAHVAAAETGTPPALAQTKAPAGSDFMVDVIKTLDIPYLPSNPASSFRGLHESLINYGKNTKPEFLTCMHEESAAAMCHGYFKVAGKPLMTLCHGTVGLQHAAMAIYNAWCDRVPMIVVGGNDLDAAKRPPGVPTFHSAQDINAMVRDFTKWDDTPVSLQHFAQSFVRAYKIAMTPPYGPVAISLDAGLQQEPIH